MQKTLILHDGEYKKWNERKAESVIPYMTSNTEPSGLVTASGHYKSMEEYAPFNAFSNNTKTGWINTDGQTTGWIAYEFESPLKVNSYEVVASRNSALPLSNHPKDWKFEGSNDNFATFDVINSQTGVTFSSFSESKKYELNNNNLYKSYRINITANNGGASFVGLGRLRMYKDYKNEIKTISSTLPTQEQFQTDGMDSLSPLLDRRVETLEPLPMTSKIGILPNESTAKIFSKKIDLKKYFDIKSLKVEVK